MELDPGPFLNVGAFGLVAILVVRWFGRLEGALDRLTAAISSQQDGQHRITRVLTLLAAALRLPSHERDTLVTQALEELERRKETRA